MVMTRTMVMTKDQRMIGVQQIEVPPEKYIIKLTRLKSQNLPIPVPLPLPSSPSRQR